MLLRVKDSLASFLIIIFICHEIQEVTCLRIVNFDVPATVTSGSPIFLRCKFELEKDKLVNLKWYFNGKEFMRFEPKSIRDETQIFHLSPLNLEKSNVINTPERGSVIHINHVDKEMAGKYRCEVTIESQFYTINKEKTMEVIPPPTTTTTQVPPNPRFYPRPKSIDLDAIADDEPSSSEVLTNAGCSIITKNWFHILMLIVYGLLFVMH